MCMIWSIRAESRVAREATFVLCLLNNTYDQYIETYVFFLNKSKDKNSKKTIAFRSAYGKLSFEAGELKRKHFLTGLFPVGVLNFRFDCEIELEFSTEDGHEAFSKSS